MDSYCIEHLSLPIHLRSKLKSPMGYLIQGSISQTTPKLISYLENKKQNKIIAVGDVVSQIMIENDFPVSVLVTDGYTKRKEYKHQVKSEKYRIIRSKCPATEITIESWLQIKMIMKEEDQIHLIIDGEEDLLVLPFVMEAPSGSSIIYGQPNEGVVIIDVNSDTKNSVKSIMDQMDRL